MELYVGVDGGGSKTEVQVLDAKLGRKVVTSGSASNPNTVGLQRTVEVVTALVDAGLKQLGGGEGDVQGLALCMSGIDRPGQVQSLKSLFQKAYPNTAIEVTNDALAALSAGTGGESGIVLIAGTGSIAVGESRQGTIARAGGYGSLFGDEGGGFDIGRQGLRAAVQCAEGRGKATDLWRLASEEFQVKRPGELIPLVYDAEHPIGTVASFARHVLEASVHDEVAMDIVRESVRSLVQMIISVRQQLNADVSNHIILAGGLLTETNLLREGLLGPLRQEVPEAEVEQLRERPSAGAVLRAWRLVK